MAEIENDKSTIEQQVMINQLADRPWDFHFIKAVEAIESQVSQRGLVGQSIHPREENLRFRANPSLGFAPADIAGFSTQTDGTHQLSVNFMGLYGPSSPLPTYFTENVIYEQGEATDQTYYLSSMQDVYDFSRQRLNITKYVQQNSQVKIGKEAGTIDIVRLTAIQQEQLQAGTAIEKLLSLDIVNGLKAGDIALEVEEQGTNTLRDFFDVFNHRLVSLFYRASRKYRPYRDYFNPSGESFYDKVYALIGAPDHKSRVDSVLHWPKLMRFAGLLAIKGASKEKLLKIVKHYFDLPEVTLIEGCERIVTIPEDQRIRLGITGEKLADNFVIGTKIADHSGMFRLILRALSIEQFYQFLPKYAASDLPKGTNHEPLRELVNFIKPSHLLCQVELQLKDDNALNFKLGRQSGNQLGVTTWFAQNKITLNAKPRSVRFILC